MLQILSSEIGIKDRPQKNRTYLRKQIFNTYMSSATGKPGLWYLMTSSDYDVINSSIPGAGAQQIISVALNKKYTNL